MQYGPLGGAVRVVIASDAPQAVAELDKLASYADQVSLVGFIRHPQELEEDLEALLPDLVLLYTGFGGLDTVELAGYLASRSAQLRVMVVVDPADALFIARLEDAGAATVGADADPATLVAALRGAVAQPPSPEEGEPPSWPGLTPLVLWPGELEAEYGTPSAAEPFPAPEPLSAPETPVAAPPPAAPTGPASSEEQAPEEPMSASSVPVFQLDTTAFEAPAATAPQAAWPGVTALPPRPRRRPRRPFPRSRIPSRSPRFAPGCHGAVRAATRSSWSSSRGRVGSASRSSPPTSPWPWPPTESEWLWWTSTSSSVTLP